MYPDFLPGRAETKASTCLLKVVREDSSFLLTQERGQGWWRNLRPSQGETSQNSIATRRGVFQAGSTHVLRACLCLRHCKPVHNRAPFRVASRGTIEFGANVRGCPYCHHATAGAWLRGCMPNRGQSRDVPILQNSLSPLDAQKVQIGGVHRCGGFGDHLNRRTRAGRTQEPKPWVKSVNHSRGGLSWPPSFWSRYICDAPVSPARAYRALNPFRFFIQSFVLVSLIPILSAYDPPAACWVLHQPWPSRTGVLSFRQCATRLRLLQLYRHYYDALSVCASSRTLALTTGACVPLS